MPHRPAPIPEGLDILQDGDAVVIRRSWFSHIVWFLIFFCIAWDSFLIFWYKMALFGSDHGPSSFHLIAILFPIGHVAVGLGLTYFVFCLFLNQTDVILRPDALTIQTHPLPWRGNQTIPASELVSFSVRTRISGSESRTVTYDLLYVNSANREKTLVKGISKPEQAEYLAMALTRFYFPDEAGTASVEGSDRA
jgi:hypothetical protein